MRIIRKNLNVVILILSLLAGNMAMAQQLVLSGKVTDSSSGESLPGVSIVGKRNYLWTVTDVDGNFTLQTSQGATLVFSFVGYKTQEIVSQGQQNISVGLIDRHRTIGRSGCGRVWCSKEKRDYRVYRQD